MHDLALVEMGLGYKAAALSMAERAIAANPIEKDVVDGPASIEILARVAAQAGEPDRAIAALQKLLSIPYEGALPVGNAPFTHRLAPSGSNVRSAAKRSTIPKVRRVAWAENRIMPNHAVRRKGAAFNMRCRTDVVFKRRNSPTASCQ